MVDNIRSKADFLGFLQRGRVPRPLGGLRGDFGVQWWRDFILSLTDNSSDLPGLIVTAGGGGGGGSTWVGLTDTPGSITARGVPTGNLAGNALELIAGGTAGQVLTSGGAGVLPTFQTNPALAGRWERIGSIITASNDASIDFVFPAGYREFIVRLLNVVPSVDDRLLEIRLSNDGGTSFITDPNYKNAVRGNRSGGVTHNEGHIGSDSFKLTLGNAGSLGVGSSGSVSGEIHIMNPLDASNITRFRSHLEYEDETVADVEVTAGGALVNTVEAHDAVSVLFESGDVTSGDLILEGLRS